MPQCQAINQRKQHYLCNYDPLFKFTIQEYIVKQCQSKFINEQNNKQVLEKEPSSRLPFPIWQKQGGKIKKRKKKKNTWSNIPLNSSPGSHKHVNYGLRHTWRPFKPTINHDQPIRGCENKRAVEAQTCIPFLLVDMNTTAGHLWAS